MALAYVRTWSRPWPPTPASATAETFNNPPFPDEPGRHELRVPLLDSLRDTHGPLGRRVLVKSIEAVFTLAETSEPDDGLYVLHLRKAP